MTPEALRNLIVDALEDRKGRDVVTLDVGTSFFPRAERDNFGSEFGLATYDTGDTFDQSMARGFIELWGMSAKVASGRDIRVAGK